MERISFLGMVDGISIIRYFLFILTNFDFDSVVLMVFSTFRVEISAANKD